MEQWERAVAAYFESSMRRCCSVEAAEKLLPGLWDVQRLRFLLTDILEFQKEITPVRTPQ
jgi:hypothetical protein